MTFHWIICIIISLRSTCNGLYISSNVDLNSEELASELEDYGFIIDSLELPQCKDRKFLDLLVHFKIASPEDLIVLSMNVNKPEFCHQLEIGKDKIVQYLKHCNPTPDQALYIKLLSGFIALKEALCDDSTFQSLFKNHENCFTPVQYKAVECKGPEDWIEYKNRSEICNIIKRIIGCYYRKTLFDCGLISAEIFNELMLKVMNAVHDVDCPNIVKESYIRDLRSLSTSGSFRPTYVNNVFILIIMLLRVIYSELYDGG